VEASPLISIASLRRVAVVLVPITAVERIDPRDKSFNPASHYPLD
jgi:hypothetical protein